MQKASWLGVEDINEVCRVDLHTSLVGDTRENFHAMPDGRAVFENVPSTTLQPKSAWGVLFGGVWRKPLETCGVRAKLVSWDCVMLVGLLKVWGNGYCSCWTTWPWSWVLQRASVVLQVSTTLVARSVSSLLPRSPSLSADGSRLRQIRPTSHLVQSVTVQECILMLINVGRLQRRLTPDSELFTVLSAEAARVAGEEAQSRKLARFGPCTDAADTNQKRTHTYPKTTRRRRTCTAPPPRRVVFPQAEPSRRNHGSVLRSHAQHVSDLLENDKGRVEVVSKAGGDGGGKLQTRSGKWLDDSKRVRQVKSNVSDLQRPVQTLQGFRRLARCTPRDPLQKMAAAAAMMEMAMVVVKDGKFVVMLVAHYTTYLRPIELCNRTVGHVALPRQGSGASS